MVIGRDPRAKVVGALRSWWWAVVAAVFSPLGTADMMSAGQAGRWIQALLPGVQKECEAKSARLEEQDSRVQDRRAGREYNDCTGTVPKSGL